MGVPLGFGLPPPLPKLPFLLLSGLVSTYLPRRLSLASLVLGLELFFCAYGLKEDGDDFCVFFSLKLLLFIRAFLSVLPVLLSETSFRLLLPNTLAS